MPKKKKGAKKAPAPAPAPAAPDAAAAVDVSVEVAAAGGEEPKLSRAERRAKERDDAKAAKKATRAKANPQLSTSIATQKGRTEVAKSLWSTGEKQPPPQRDVRGEL